MDLIKTLKLEHIKILDFFDKIDATKDFGARKALFHILATVTASHLKKEDELFYPVLANSSEMEIRKLGTIFSDAMKGYALEFNVVIQKVLASNNVLSFDLEADYAKMRDRIKHRIELEETVLYPAYKKIV